MRTIQSPRACAAAAAPVVAAFILGLSACAPDTTEPALTTRPEFATHAAYGGYEGELFGDLWTNGSRTKDAGYFVTLDAFDTATSSRLRDFNPVEWADTSAHCGLAGCARWMWEWSDPKAGGNCGGLTPYINGDESGRQPEVHRPQPGVDPSGLEKHCIRWGQYTFTVSRSGTNIKQVRLDYVPGTGGLIWNSTAGRYEVQENPIYDDTSSTYGDLVIPVDRTPGAFTDIRHLDVQNTGGSLSGSFADNANPSGTDQDWFRFSVARASSTWNRDVKGTFLSRVFWNYGRNWGDVSGYYDATDSDKYSIIRVKKFTELTQSQLDTVAAEVMRPDEQPDSSSARVAKRTIQFTRVTPLACASLEGTSVWRTSDQYLVASTACSSTGANMRYRWQFDMNGVWTPYTTDTLYDFGGYGTTGQHQLTLEVHNSTTGYSGTDTKIVSVQSPYVSLTGQTYIVTKDSFTYTSNHTGYWYERYDPDLAWHRASFRMQQTLVRIWPAGDYTQTLRQDSSTGTLRRGRLTVTVCTESGCSPPKAAPMVSPNARVAGANAVGWHLFGGGPWLAWSAGGVRHATRLYDLWGMHDLATPFADATWVNDSGGAAADPSGAWRLAWDVVPTLPTADARVFRFRVTPSAGVPVVFGMALDPDLGPDAADDVSGYDAARGLVYVADGSAAVGYLLRDANGDALRVVRQYGVGRFAPELPADAAAAVEGESRSLLTGPRDVQLVLGARAEGATADYFFVLLRGVTVSDLQRLADVVLAKMGP